MTNLPTGYDNWKLGGPKPPGKYLGVCGVCCRDHYGERGGLMDKCACCKTHVCPDCLDEVTGLCKNCAKAGDEDLKGYR